MTTASKFTVALVQMRMGADPEANFASAVKHIREAARRGAQIVCLPELFRTQYFCQREDLKLFNLAEPIPGPTTKALSALARELSVSIVASLFERRAPGLYHNTAVTLNSDGQIAGVYRKMHVPDDPLYHEKYYFTLGDLGFQAVDTSAGRVGTLVCWTSGIPRARASPRCKAPRCCSFPRLSAGTRRKRMSLAPRSSTRGGPSSGRMPSPMASTWLP